MELRRRDLLRGALTGLGALAVIKVGGRVVFGPKVGAERLAHLSPRQEAIYVAAALVVVGAPGQAAYAAGGWDPAFDLDGVLGLMAPDQARLVGVGLHLFEEWTPGLTGFAERSEAERLAWLERWRLSDLGIQRSLWAVIHSLSSASFAGTSAGLAYLGHPGPCVASPGYPGRAPGQTAPVIWDEIVP